MQGSLETRLRGRQPVSNCVSDRVGARVDARKSRDAFERTSTPYRTVSVIVSEPELMRGSLETRLRGH